MTFSFIWSNLHYKFQQFTKRPWARCTARYFTPCGFRDNMQTCDGSEQAGKDQRWDCGSTLDQVQLPNSTQRRNFNVITHGGLWDSMHIYKAQTLEVDDEGDWTWIKDATPKFYAALHHEFNESDSMNNKCWTSNGNDYGGKEFLVSPLTVKGITCPQCGNNVTRVGGVDCKQNNAGLNKAHNIFREEQLRSGVIGTIFDDWLDAFTITSETLGAPWSIPDGAHYPRVVYRSIVITAMYKLFLLHGQKAN